MYAVPGLRRKHGVFLMDKSANERQVGGKHYQNQPIQCWDYIAVNDIPFLEGNVIKYVSRWRDKGGVQDLHKARHYLDKLIELYTPPESTDG